MVAEGVVQEVPEAASGCLALLLPMIALLAVVVVVAAALDAGSEMSLLRLQQCLTLLSPLLRHHQRRPG